MDVIRGYQALTRPPKRSAVTIGNFDGVHRGHQALIAEMRAKAQVLEATSVVYTFEPHPAKILNPALAPVRLTPAHEKLRLIENEKVDLCVVEPFTLEFAATSAEQFVSEVLVKALSTKALVVGYDFTFGKGGSGSVKTLEQGGAQYGFSVDIVTPQRFSGIVASSTKIREFILEGKVEAAALLLGRHYALSGKVVTGQKRGRTIGFPTANIDTNHELLPRYGVYACWATLADGRRLAAVSNVGLRPTVANDNRATVEAYLFDFAGDLYEQQLTLEFVAHLRHEQRFASLDALKAQIAFDASAAKKRLGVG